MHQISRPLVGLIAGLLLLIGSGIPAFLGDYAAYANTSYTLSLPGLQDVQWQNSSVATAGSASTASIDIRKLPVTNRQPYRTYELQLVLLRTPAAAATTAVQAATTTETRTMVVLNKWWIAGSATLGLLLLILSVPGSLFRNTRVRRIDNNTSVTGWYYLLAEPQGLSLSRLQLVIWFLPAILCYAIISLPLHQFPDIPSSLLPLLGLGGATAALSATVSNPASASYGSGGGTGGGGGGGQPAAAPVSPLPAPAQASFQQAATGYQPAADTSPATGEASAPAAAPAPLTAESLAQAMVTAMQSVQNQAPSAAPAAAQAVLAEYSTNVYVEPPRLGDLVEDFNGYGDMSRYQYLILCLIGASAFFITFLQTWNIPELPAQFVPLVATSQATYLAVKAIKYVRGTNQSA